MYNAGEFPEYEDLYKELDQYLATALVEVEKEADAFGEEFANRHKDDKIHYFVSTISEVVPVTDEIITIVPSPTFLFPVVKYSAAFSTKNESFDFSFI